MHDELSEGLVKVSIKECIKEIRRKDVCGYRNFPILTEVERIPFGGSLDDVIFYEAMPVLVADLRTTSRSSLWPGRDKLVQVYIYGLGLDYVGFDCSELKLMIGVEHVGIRRSSDTAHINMIYRQFTAFLMKGAKLKRWKECPLRKDTADGSMTTIEVEPRMISNGRVITAWQERCDPHEETGKMQSA